MNIGDTVKLSKVGILKTKKSYSVETCKSIRGVIIANPATYDNDLDYEDESDLLGFAWVTWNNGDTAIQINENYLEIV